MRRQPKARGTKEKARVERFHSLTDKAGDKGSRTQTIDLVESKPLRMGDVIVEFDNASLAFGEGASGVRVAFPKSRPPCLPIRD